MNFILAPWQIAFSSLSGGGNERQQQGIEFQDSQIEAMIGTTPASESQPESESNL